MRFAAGCTACCAVALTRSNKPLLHRTSWLQKPGFGLQMPATPRLRQCLSVCTSKASKLSTAARLEALEAVFV
jgi:hypothetical protein